MILTSGRLVEYEGGGDETRSNPWLAELQQDMFVEINPRDANDLGIRDGELVWVEGPEKAKVKVMAMVTERVARGVAFMPMHLRIPFVAGVSLLWTMVLSAMRGGDVAHSEDLAGGNVTGRSFELVMEGLDAFNQTPVELDTNMDHISLSAAGSDRPGLVAMLSRHVADFQGNVTHSKMVRLGDEFIVQMHVALPKETSKNFLTSLKRKNTLKRDLDVQAKPLTQRVCPNKKAVLGMKIHCVGIDRPGMLAEVAEKLASKGMSLEDVSTKLRMSKDGQREFVIDALASSKKLEDKENLDACIADISSLKEELNLTHFDMRVHTA